MDHTGTGDDSLHRFFIGAAARRRRAAQACGGVRCIILNHHRLCPQVGFVGLLPRTIAMQEVAQGRLRILRLPFQMVFPPVAFVCRRERIASPEGARFHRIVRSVVLPAGV